MDESRDCPAVVGQTYRFLRRDFHAVIEVLRQTFRHSIDTLRCISCLTIIVTITVCLAADDAGEVLEGSWT